MQLNWTKNPITKHFECLHGDYFCTVGWVYQAVEWAVWRDKQRIGFGTDSSIKNAKIDVRAFLSLEQK
jgi:hypothetical protein